MSWAYHCRIAGLVVRIDSDSAACEQDMRKFLKLYQAVEPQAFDVRLSVVSQDDGYRFVFENSLGETQDLWFSTDEREVTAALEIHLYRQVIEHLNARHIISLHAAVLNTDGKAVMFAGASGSGKSSMCTAGILAGAVYFSDEFALLDTQGCVHPFPRPMQWAVETHPAFDRSQIEASPLMDSDYFDFPDASGGETRCFLWHPTQIQRQPLPLRHMVFHQYDASLPQAVFTEIPRHEALMCLPEHLHIQRGMAKDLPMLNGRIDPSCRFYRLRFPDVFAAWRLVEQAVQA